MLKNDISFHLSGGLNNTDPSQSLGGAISRQQIDSNTNNLFDDVKFATASNGGTDYRCLYIVNNSKSEKLADASVYIKKSLTGAQIVVGVQNVNEVQALIVQGTPVVGAKFQLYYLAQKGRSFLTREIVWVEDINVMAQRVAAVLNSLGIVKGIQCSATDNGNGTDFLITFTDGRAQTLLGIADPVGVNATIQRIVSGGPINAPAPAIGIANNPPSGVNFLPTDVEQRVVLGTMLPGDMAPIWFKRTVQKNTPVKEGDRLKLFVVGKDEPVLKNHGVMPD